MMGEFTPQKLANVTNQGSFNPTLTPAGELVNIYQHITEMVNKSASSLTPQWGQP